MVDQYDISGKAVRGLIAKISLVSASRRVAHIRAAARFMFIIANNQQRIHFRNPFSMLSGSNIKTFIINWLLHPGWSRRLNDTRHNTVAGMSNFLLREIDFSSRLL